MKITVIGTYLHADPIYIGGTQVRQGVSRELMLSEDEFIRLINGMKNGWFKIQSHNYAKFLEAERKPMHYDVDAMYLFEKGIPVYQIPPVVTSGYSQVVGETITDQKAAITTNAVADADPVMIEPVVEPVIEETVVEPVIEETVIEPVIEETVVEETATEKPKRGRKSKNTEE